MKRTDRIKLNFIRNWNLPGKERLAHLFSPSKHLKQDIHDGIVFLNTDDIAIYTTADNYIEWTILNTGTYENEINKIIRISLKPSENALDIGANIGLQSIRMSQCIGDTGTVYSFEPLEHLQKKFRKNIALNKINNITLLPYALSDIESEAEFNIDENAWNQGAFSLHNSQGSKKQTISIKVADQLPVIKTLDSLALVKIDVEGYEYQVLRGLSATLQKHKPRIIFEYDYNYWVSTGQNIADCYTYLQMFGYTLYKITSVGCELISQAKDITSGNILCIHV